MCNNFESETKDFRKLYEDGLNEFLVHKKQNYEFAQTRKYFEKYYIEASDNLLYLDPQEIFSQYLKFEEDFKNRSLNLLEMEMNFKNNFMKEHVSFQDNLIVEKKCISSLKDKLLMTTKKLEKLESQSLYSIKKMKSDYESADPIILQKLIESLKNEKKEIENIMKVSEEKDKVLFEKEATYNLNVNRVKSKEIDVELLSDKLSRIIIDNQSVLDDISSYNHNNMISEAKLQELKERLNFKIFYESRFSSKGKKQIYSLKLDADSKKLLFETNQILKDIEFQNMQLGDYLCHIIKAKKQVVAKCDGRKKILYLSGIAMNISIMKIKNVKFLDFQFSLNLLKKENEKLIKYNDDLKKILILRDQKNQSIQHLHDLRNLLKKKEEKLFKKCSLNII